jgi:sulfhydrogenase subunit beta (sulfur reductase)
MAPKAPRFSSCLMMSPVQLDQLLQVLIKRDYEVLGPTVREGAVVYDHVSSTKDFPVGWTDEQSGGKYRLKHREDGALFGFVVGPQSWKRFLFPPVARLWQAHRSNGFFEIVPEVRKPTKFAFIGMRACELHALGIQDKVFLQGPFVDPVYKLHRENVFIVAVDCVQAGGTCFCSSMKTGPKAAAGFDLALTEVIQEGRHQFVVRVGTKAGADLLSQVPHEEATPADVEFAENLVAEAAKNMGRTLDVNGIKEMLYRNTEHARWDQVADRCLSCSNCTMVCPTCFCSNVEDLTDLSGQQAERWRKWDSCFTTDFSYIHGSSVRSTPRSKYRQWMMHKLAYWFDQFGTSGCVGCGRCITWCPVGIDITEEARVIRESETFASAAG